MATYTAAQLNGAGTPCEEVSGLTLFEISSSTELVAYFTMETVRNSNGFYDNSSPTNGLGTFSNLNNVISLITSSYIASICVGFGSGSFEFTPASDIQTSSSFFRGTGGISIGVSGSLISHLLTEGGDFLITENGNDLIR